MSDDKKSWTANDRIAAASLFGTIGFIGGFIYGVVTGPPGFFARVLSGLEYGLVAGVVLAAMGVWNTG